MSVPLQKLEDQLNCSICLGTYTNPKLLKCNHVYCQQCVVRLVVQDQQGRLVLTCPNCRQVTPVPANGVAGLQSAFRENQLLEIVKEHRNPNASAERVETASTSSGNIAVVCADHGENEVKLYCETCEETICWECIMKGGKHHYHEYYKLDKAFERYKEKIMPSLQPLEKQLATIEKALTQFDARHDQISHQQSTTEAKIHRKFSQLQETLDARKTELISQLHQLTQNKLKSLAAQRGQLVTTHASATELFLLKQNLQSGNQKQVLQMKSTKVNQLIEELSTTLQFNKLKPTIEADIRLSVRVNFKAVCQYLQVYAAGLPDPSNCQLKDKLVETVTIGEKCTAVLQVFNSGNRQCKVPTTSISCELKSEITGTVTRCSIEEGEKSEFAISYQANIKGSHQLHIKIESQHIRGSPFTFVSKSSVENLGTSLLSIIDGVEGPEGIAVNQKGQVIVTEYNRDCVTIFSPSGRRHRSFGTRGSGQGQFNHPAGVAVDADDNIFVVDQNNCRIQKFTSQGEFVTSVGTRGRGPFQFYYPHGIACSGNRLYVGDFFTDSIQILSSDLTNACTFGTKGSGKGQFNFPEHVACDSKGNVYVADSYNHRIQVFTANGEFLIMFGKYGKNRGELNQPWGIAIDSSDRVYVSEIGNHRVSVFTSEGRLLKTFGGRALVQFEFPCGVAVDNCGVVYVCDRINNRIQLFS